MEGETSTAGPTVAPRSERRVRRLLHAATLGAVVVGLACLFCARHTMSGTFDESNHLAAGLEWWQFGTYTMWTENPPLSRLAIAAVPYLHGMRLPPREAWEPKTHHWDRSWDIGNDLLYAGDGFETNLGRARLGTLPFFLLALASVWLLADGRRRPGAGLVAVALTATLPALIAHGALATTDMTFAATFLLAALALQRWFEAPTRGRAVALGAAFALALLSKFSVLLFFPVTAAAFLAARHLAGTGALPAQLTAKGASMRRALVGQTALMAVTAFLVTWAGYRFSVGRVGDLTPEVGGWLYLLPPPGERKGLAGLLLRLPVPMPELLHGFRFLVAHDIAGHDAYLLGKTAGRGFLAFYPVALLVKTPPPFLLLGLATAVGLARRRFRGPWQGSAIALTSASILLLSLPSHVNLGIRHVFVVLPLAAVAIGRATEARLAALVGRPRRVLALAVALLITAQAGIAVGARRTELGYFNALARDPAAVLLDSDLDWGQDLLLLRQEVRARGVDELKIAFFGTLHLCKHGLPHLEALRPGVPTTGWIAISENYYRHRSAFKLLKVPCDPKSTYTDDDVIPPRAFAWLKAYRPVAIVGSSVRLYHIEALANAVDHDLPAR